MSLSTGSLGETVKERGLLRKSIVIMLLVTLLLNLVPVVITAQFDPLRIIQHAAFAFFMVSAISFYALVLAHVSGDVELRVKDDGQGFRFEESMEQAIRCGHIGLHSMRERVAELGGAMRVISAPGHGAELIFTFPPLYLTTTTLPDVAPQEAQLNSHNVLAMVGGMR